MSKPIAGTCTPVDGGERRRFAVWDRIDEVMSCVLAYRGGGAIYELNQCAARGGARKYHPRFSALKRCERRPSMRQGLTVVVPTDTEGKPEPECRHMPIAAIVR